MNLKFYKASEDESNDISLLKHEYAESVFEKLFNTNYDTAHDAIKTTWPWSDPKFLEK